MANNNDSNNPNGANDALKKIAETLKNIEDGLLNETKKKKFDFSAPTNNNSNNSNDVNDALKQIAETLKNIEDGLLKETEKKDIKQKMKELFGFDTAPTSDDQKTYDANVELEANLEGDLGDKIDLPSPFNEFDPGTMPEEKQQTFLLEKMLALMINEQMVVLKSIMNLLEGCCPGKGIPPPNEIEINSNKNQGGLEITSENTVPETERFEGIKELEATDDGVVERYAPVPGHPPIELEGADKTIEKTKGDTDITVTSERKKLPDRISPDHSNKTKKVEDCCETEEEKRERIAREIRQIKLLEMILECVCFEFKGKGKDKNKTDTSKVNSPSFNFGEDFLKAFLGGLGFAIPNLLKSLGNLIAQGIKALIPFVTKNIWKILKVGGIAAVLVSLGTALFDGIKDALMTWEESEGDPWWKQVAKSGAALIGGTIESIFEDINSILKLVGIDVVKWWNDIKAPSAAANAVSEEQATYESSAAPQTDEQGNVIAPGRYELGEMFGYSDKHLDDTTPVTVPDPLDENKPRTIDKGDLVLEQLRFHYRSQNKLKDMMEEIRRNSTTGGQQGSYIINNGGNTVHVHQNGQGSGQIIAAKTPDPKVHEPTFMTLFQSHHLVAV